MKQLDAQYKQIACVQKTLQMATKQRIDSFGIMYKKFSYTFYPLLKLCFIFVLLSDKLV